MSCALREQLNVPIVPLSPNAPVVGYGVRVVPNPLGSPATVEVIDPMLGHSTSRHEKSCARFGMPPRLDEMLTGSCNASPYTDRLMPMQTRRIQSECNEQSALESIARTRSELDWATYEPEPASPFPF
jgi:hypothetical protein